MVYPGMYLRKSKQAFLIAKPVFSLNCIFKVTPRSCFLEQFEPVIRAFSTSELSGQQALSDIPVSLH